MAHCQEFIDAISQSTEVEIPAAQESLDAALLLFEQRLLALWACEEEHMQAMEPDGGELTVQMQKRHSDGNRLLAKMKQENGQLHQSIKAIGG